MTVQDAIKIIQSYGFDIFPDGSGGYVMYDDVFALAAGRKTAEEVLRMAERLPEYDEEDQDS